MAIRLLGLFSNFSVPAIKYWGRIHRASFSTAKIEKSFQQHTNNKIPTPEQIERDPALKKKIIQEYKELAEDSDFQQVTEYAMKMGLESLRRNKLT